MGFQKLVREISRKYSKVSPMSDETCVHTKLSEFSCDGLPSHGSEVAGTHLWLAHEEDQKKVLEGLRNYPPVQEFLGL